LTLQVPFTARDFRAVQTAADLHFDSLGAEPQRLFNRLAHRAAKRNSLFELRRNLLGLQLCIQLRLVNLLNRNQNLTAGARRDITLELVDLGSLAPDDDARTRSVDDDLQAIRSALDVDVRHARAGKTLLQIALQLQIFDQEIAILPLRKPMRMPVLVVAQAKTVWMNFLAQTLLLFGIRTTYETNLFRIRL